MPISRRSYRRSKHPLMRPAAVFLLAVSLFLLLSPTAFAKTYVITDGDRVVTCTTFATDPYEVVSAAGLELDGSAICTSEDGTSITIRRSSEVTLSYRGDVSHVRAEEETVAQLLARLGLDVTRQDTLSHPLETPVTDGMVLRIDRVETREETYATVIPHETTLCDDPSLPAGKTQVLVEGRNGQLMCTAEVTYRNGMEVQRTVLNQVQTIAPVTQIIAQGTGNPEFEGDSRGMPTIGDSYIIMPSGELLTYHKTDNVTATGYTHTDPGCDLITSTGTTVRYGTAAVDPRFIPYGTRMLIVSHDGERFYGVATAEDCGGAIKRDKMDLYFPTYDECIQFGRRRCTIYFLD